MDDSLHDSEHYGVAVAEADSDELVDRLSELPDSLILHNILSLMPMEDVVITTLLSKRWKDLWTTVPGLDFRNHTDKDLDKFQNFVCEALALWRGAKIHKFSLSFMIDQSKGYLDFLLHFAIEKQVEELYIELIIAQFALRQALFFQYPESHYYAPQCLYSCSSLTTLTLVSFTLNITERVRWNKLKSLTIQGASLIEKAMNDHILPGSPQLEVLNLSFRESGEDLNIESSSLKMLKIDMYLVCLSDNPPKSTVLRILAPNLESLEILGVSYSRCLLNVPLLTSATLGFDERDWYLLLDEMLWQVFLAISHVQKLTLTDWCIKFLLEMKRKDMHVLFSNAKILKLYPEGADGIIDVLGIFPELRMLVVEHNEVMSLFKDEEELYINAVDDACNTTLAPKAILPNPSILQLKTVEITWQLRHTSIFPIIGILLTNAHMLEKMVIRLRTNGSDPEMFVLAEEKVLSMPRSSPNVRVTIIDIY